MKTLARLKTALVAVFACTSLFFTGTAHASPHHHHHAHWHAQHRVVTQAMAAAPIDPPVVHMRYFGGPKGGMWPEVR